MPGTSRPTKTHGARGGLQTCEMHAYYSFMHNRSEIVTNSNFMIEDNVTRCLFLSLSNTSQLASSVNGAVKIHTADIDKIL